jgi:adenosylcobinamide-phosphate guanylyltransferase
MCGGQGTRLDAPFEKPLFEVAGRAMVDRVCDALVDSDVGTVVTAVSPHAPDTREHLYERGDCTVVETPGDGYVADLDAAMTAGDLAEPVVTCVADLPLLTPRLVDETLAAARGVDGSLTVAVPAALKTALGVSADTTTTHDGREVAPVGLNVVGGPPEAGDDIRLTWDARLAVTVDRVDDAAVAEQLS